MWLLTSKLGRAVLGLIVMAALLAGTSLYAHHRGYVAGQAVGNAAVASLKADLAEATAAATTAARKAEQAQADALSAAAQSYERGRDDAQAHADRVIADLRAGNIRLRARWSAPAACRVPAPAASVARADAAERSRQESAGRIVLAADQCDAQVAALQDVIRAYLKTANGAHP